MAETVESFVLGLGGSTLTRADGRKIKYTAEVVMQHILLRLVFWEVCVVQRKCVVYVYVYILIFMLSMCCLWYVLFTHIFEHIFLASVRNMFHRSRIVLVFVFLLVEVFECLF